MKKYPNDKTISQLSKNVTQIYPEMKVEIEMENMSIVKAEKIIWLWENIIAKGKMTLLAGEPGVGKSQLLLYIASIISNGDKFHFEYNKCDAGNVLLICGEDKAEDTIAPRLMALQANLKNIDYVKGIKKTDKNGNSFFDAICLIENLADLEKKIIERNYKLIIVDPISIYLGSIDENKNKEIRSALNMIGALAERHGISLLLNSHFSKPSGNATKNAIYRVMGSIGFAAAARIVFGVMKDPENPDRRLFIPIKNNLGEDKLGYVYNIKPMLVDEQIKTSKVEWLNEKIEKTANEILNSSTVQVSSPRLEEAKNMITDMLKFGSCSLSEIRKRAKELNISVDRLYAARDELKIYENPSIGLKRGIIWSLPS